MYAIISYIYIYAWDVCYIDESYEKQTSVGCDKQCRYVVVLQSRAGCSGVVMRVSCILYYTTQFTVQIISVFIVINKTRALISTNSWWIFNNENLFIIWFFFVCLWNLIIQWLLQKCSKYKWFILFWRCQCQPSVSTCVSRSPTEISYKMQNDNSGWVQI